MHQRGVIYLAEDRNHGGSIVLDPKFLSHAVRCIVSYRRGFPEYISVIDVTEGGIKDVRDICYEVHSVRSWVTFYHFTRSTSS